MPFKSFLKQLRADQAGATAIEYGLIVSLIVIASIGAFNGIANENDGLWARVSNSVSAVL
ncbi:MAG: Flp family type IVb pilin [Sphingomonadaceae bacterium]